MKALRILWFAAAVCLAVLSARGADLAPPLLLGTNGVIRNYTNFFDANIDLLTDALDAAGYSAGGGSGNANTNNATAWAAQQTFLGPVLLGPTNLVAKLSALDSGKQSTDPDLDALAGLALTGVMARTGSATYAARTLTGDAELLISNGDGVAGNPLFSIAGSLTRDSELTAAIAALSSTYAPLASPSLTGNPLVNGTNFMALLFAKQVADADLDGLAGLTGTGLIARTGSGTYAERTITGDAEITVTNGNGVSGNPVLAIGAGIARVAAMAATYQPIATILTRLSGIGLGASGDILIRDANGWTNLVKSTDGKVLTLSGGIPSWQTPGGGGGDAFLANSQTFSGATNQFTGQVIVSNLLATVLRAATLVLDVPIGLTAVGTNIADAQDELQLTPGVYTLPWDLQVWQLASMTWASGTMPYFDGANVTNLQSTATGRLLIASADAAAARAAIAAPTWPSDAGYDEAAWNGDTNAPTKNAVRDAIVAVVGSSNSVITSVDTNTFSTPGGKLTLNVNSGIPRWIDAVGIGTLTNINTATNGLGSWLISSNDVPGADGRYLDGTLSFAITNAAGGTVNFNFYVKLNGTVILNAQRSVSSSANLDLHEGRFRLIRQGTGLANFAYFGERHGASVPTVGMGSLGGSGGDSLLWATNAVCDWTTNVNLVIELVQSNLSGTNNAAAGSQRFGASLYRP